VKGEPGDLFLEQKCVEIEQRLSAHPRARSVESMGKLSIIKEFWGFLKIRKKFWLLPIILVMVLLGLLIILSEGSAVTPFIYTLF